MLKKYLAIMIVFALIAPLAAYAQTVLPTEVNSTPKPNLGLKLGPTIRQEFANQRQASHGAMRDVVKNIFTQRMLLREQLKETLQTKLAAFRDEKKKEIILRLDTKIASISARRTTRMSEAITKLETILNAIKQKANDLPGPCDKTNLTAAIVFAEDTIDSASAAVEVQANKTYSFGLVDESSAKANIGQTVSQLQKDLRNTHKAVQDAKQAVVKAAVELRRLKACAKISSFPTASPSATPFATPSVTLTPTAI